jgi:tetratricopeptide (TPR) repeat protein
MDRDPNRDRLKEVHQTDLTEGRVNEDFVDWLKSKGPTWLLVILVAICAYIGIVRFRQHKDNYRAEAWGAFLQAELPGSLADVAREYGDVDQIANLARLQAGDQYLSAVQSGRTLDGLRSAAPVPGATTPPQEPSEEEVLTEENRGKYLDLAANYYRQVVEDDDGSLGMTVHVVNAYNGLAAVAEARGDAEAAAKHYEQAAERCEKFYPGLSQQARRRAESAEQATHPVTLPSDPTFARNIAPPRRTHDIDEALRPLLLPAAGEE